ncbi:hypothetical protein FRB99_005300 [Tulasnella sp. 403]|nr:hypothetical protein FRB99_005300 [Tulasnella sp. 403]
MPPKGGGLAPLLKKLGSAKTPLDAKGPADSIARTIKTHGLIALADQNVLTTLIDHISGKSSYARIAGAAALQSLATIIREPVLPLLMPSVPLLLNMYADEDDSARNTATRAMQAITTLTPVEGLGQLIETIAGELKVNGKWKAKVGCLKEIARTVDIKGQEGKEELAALLGSVLPVVEEAMHDTKNEVSTEAVKTATVLCSTLPNPDLLPHVNVLIESMKAPGTVPAAIKALSNTTFVTEVTAPSLAVLIPLLQRALNDRSMEVQRRAVIILENVCKLVRDPVVAAQYLNPLVEGVVKIKTTASFPEVRAFAESAYDTLIKAGASTDGGAPPPSRDLPAEAEAARLVILSLLPPNLVIPSPNDADAPGTPFHPYFDAVVNFISGLVAELVHRNAFTASDQPKWIRCLGAFVEGWGEEVKSQSFAEEARMRFLAIELAKGTGSSGEQGNEDVIVDTIFSLAYGALLLLSHTRLRLVRGRRYGICAGNGMGKSTLLRAIRDGKVENFPPQSEVRAVMVEHALQGEDRSLSIIDFIAADKELEGVARSQIREQLTEADLLLLDEPTNHLDVSSVRWLEEWLLGQKNVTCLIVSHDSGFLDNVTTDIIHYESKKLVYYPGPLKAFVEKVPSAQSYYTLAATSIRFSFPPPGSLMGVRSNTRAILKLKDCTYTYPGRDSPSLSGVTCALSLSSRVGIIGPNGAGKSTLIRLLTGEASPQEGTVYKHPSLRVGYVAQHATHHIEQHLEKTPVGYIQWRFQDGHDKEVLEKSTRVLTAEDRELLEQDWVGKTGEKRKIEMIMGRQKLKKSFQYEIKWRGMDHKFNTWVAREELLEKGFTKLVQRFDDLESSREGAGSKETTLSLVRKHLEEVGLDGDIAQYNEMGGLSGGQKMKVVIAAALWNNPQIVVLDEVTNFLDREAIGGVAVAIREWSGAVCIISHNTEFVNALCPEMWNMEGGRLTRQGKAAVVEDAFLDVKDKSKPSSRLASRRASPAVTPQTGTPAASGTEDAGGASTPGTKKKKLTRNQLKAKEERRRLRKLHWLTYGGPKPDSDSE